MAYLIQTQNPSVINSPAMSTSYQRFDSDREKEIIVWIRQLKDMDKQQITDEIINKFNISNGDAERLYYEAYPDGLSTTEEEIVDCFEQILPQENPQQLVDDTIMIIVQEEDPTFINQHNNIDEETSELFLYFINSMLQSRKLV